MKKLLSIFGALTFSFLFIWNSTDAAIPIPTNWIVNNEVQMFLEKSVTPTQTLDIQIAAPKRNGDTITFATTSGGMLRLTSGRRQEDVWYSSGSVNAVTKIITLYGVIRDVCPDQPKSIVSCNDGKQWSRGSIVELNNDARLYNWKLNENTVNTLTQSGALRSDSTVQPFLFLNGQTTDQIGNFTYNGAAGDHGLTYDSTQGCFAGFDGSSWLCLANTTGALVNATATIRGVVTLASSGASFTGSGQGIGGSTTVIPSTLTTASGGGVNRAGYIPVFDNSNRLSGSTLAPNPTGTTFLRGDQVWAAVVSSPWFGQASSGSKVYDSTTTFNPTQELSYSTLTIDAAVVLSPISSGSIVIFKTTGDTAINGTINLDRFGGLKGTGVADDAGGVGSAGNSLLSGITTGGGGGGEVGSGDGDDGAGGGGGASFVSDGTIGSTPAATAGAAGTVITSSKAAFLSGLLRGVTNGGGGGAGGGDQNGNSKGADGGSGGGAMVMFVGGDLTLGASSVITADGGNGCAGADPVCGGENDEEGGGGGGGGGTVVILVAGTITDNGVSVTATGGGGGNDGANNAGGNGGAGAAGNIIIYSLETGQLITN